MSIIGDGIMLGAGGESASIFVTGLSETDTVTATKDGKTITGKWTQKLNPASVVPDGYTQLEYLQSTGTQYIVTGLNSTTRYDHEITFSDYAYAKTQGILGSSGYYYSYTGYNNTLRWCMSDRAYDTPGSLTSKRTAKLGYNYLTVDGSSVSQISDTNGTPSDTTHTLFKGYNCASVKIYSYRASLDGQLLRDFVPCKRNSDNELGMYDLVNDVFYTNSGTGEFVSGPEVPQTIDGFLIDKIKSYGTWTVTSTNGTKTATGEVVVDSAVEYTVPFHFGVLYEDGKMNIPLSFSVTSTSGQIVDTGAVLDVQYVRGQGIGDYNSYAEAVIYTDDVIDLTGYSTLYVSGVNIVYPRNFSVLYDNSEIATIPTNRAGGDRGNIVRLTQDSVDQNSVFTHSADISGITYGRLYIRSMTSTGMGGGDNIHQTISKIWLE